MSAQPPELVTVTIDGQRAPGPEGAGHGRDGRGGGDRDPGLLLRAPPRPAGRGLPDVPLRGRGHAEAPGRLHAHGHGRARRSGRPATSEKAAEGQNAILEFILLNHPLDCPDCDKGGECPLQDLTFRFGPGSTRMHFPKRTFDKPIPISPLIALDRERCILCYRCTRFSENVSEDGQLVAVNRGASSVIATFEDEPYRAHFSGNVVELCPVGALTSTTYRFRARPWEIQNVPTVCGLCPVGCNVWATTREGKVARILSRNHPEIHEGWLCDKGRFAYDHLRAPDRIRAPLVRVRRRGFEASLQRAGARRGRDRAARGRRRRSSSRSPAARPSSRRPRSPASSVRGSAPTRPSSRTTGRAASPPSARRSPRSRTPTCASCSATTRWSSGLRSSTSGCAPPGAGAPR